MPSCLTNFSSPINPNFMKTLFVVNQNVRVGMNRLQINNSNLYMKGSFIAVKTVSGSLAISSSYSELSDHAVNNNNELVKLNLLSNWRFCLKVLVEIVYFESTFHIQQNYNQNGVYNFSINLNSLGLVRQIFWQQYRLISKIKKINFVPVSLFIFFY